MEDRCSPRSGGIAYNRHLKDFLIAWLPNKFCQTNMNLPEALFCKHVLQKFRIAYQRWERAKPNPRKRKLAFRETSDACILIVVSHSLTHIRDCMVAGLFDSACSSLRWDARPDYRLSIAIIS